MQPELAQRPAEKAAAAAAPLVRVEDLEVHFPIYKGVMRTAAAQGEAS